MRIKLNHLHVWSKSKILQIFLLGQKLVFMFIISLRGNVERSFAFQLLIWTNMFPHWGRPVGKYCDTSKEDIFKCFSKTI